MGCNRFEGFYYKHQKNGRTLCVIAGRAKDHAFIQAITDDGAFIVQYPLLAYTAAESVTRIGACTFGPDGITLSIQRPELTLAGRIDYSGLTPLPSDIMGPFRFLPMQCRHRIVSLRHSLSGGVRIGGEYLDFSGGIGYIEGDSGRSFPRSYTWVHCGDLPKDSTVTLAIADIPVAGLHFKGCIAVVGISGRQYRLATYGGVKIVRHTENEIILRQKSWRLMVNMDGRPGHKLLAPLRGRMTREIYECVACRGRFRFYEGGALLLDAFSERASFEHVPRG